MSPGTKWSKRGAATDRRLQADLQAESRVTAGDFPGGVSIGEVPRDDLHLKTQIRITLDISVVTWWKPQHHAALFFWTVPQHRHVVRGPRLALVALGRGGLRVERGLFLLALQTGRGSCWARVCEYVKISVGAVDLKKKKKVKI